MINRTTVTGDSFPKRDVGERDEGSRVKLAAPADPIELDDVLDFAHHGIKEVPPVITELTVLFVRVLMHRLGLAVGDDQ